MSFILFAFVDCHHSHCQIGTILLLLLLNAGRPLSYLHVQQNSGQRCHGWRPHADLESILDIVYINFVTRMAMFCTMLGVWKIWIGLYVKLAMIGMVLHDPRVSYRRI